MTDPQPPVTPLDIPSRQRQLPAGGQHLHRRILRAFLDTGRPPVRDDLRTMSAELGLDVDIAVRGLADVDLVHLGSAGRVVVAYPFSGRDTGIRVELRDGPRLHAMCAIDALGIPPMAGRDAVITATDPYSGEPIRIESTGGRWSWRPEHTVVLVGRNGSGTTSADTICPSITFHTTEENASEHLASQADLTGKILSREEAIEVAASLFGGLLDS
jgi:alkylmercury lyase